MKPVVRNKRTNDLYFYEGENRFTNIRSGIGGVVSDEAARKTFSINSEATILLNENPNVVELIKRLGLVIETKQP
jgi:hypothetical protein